MQMGYSEFEFLYVLSFDIIVPNWKEFQFNFNSVFGCKASDLSGVIRFCRAFRCTVVMHV